MTPFIYGFNNYISLGLKCLFFACLGVTTEVAFVAITDTITTNNDIYHLKGHSYLWVLPLYAIIPVLGPLFRQKTTDFRLLGKYIIAAGIIMLFELLSGILLHFTIGYCPWEYKHGFHFLGFVRLDYLPLWIAFSYVANHIDINIHLDYYKKESLHQHHKLNNTTILSCSESKPCLKCNRCKIDLYSITKTPKKSIPSLNSVRRVY